MGRLAGARARGWGSGVLSRERQRSADRGGGAAGAGQSRPGSPGRPRHWGPRSAEGPAPRSAGTNPAEHHPQGRILVEAGGSATPSPRGRTGPGRAPPDGYRGGARGWAPGLRGPGPWWLWAGAGGTGRASGLRLVRGGAWKGRAGSGANPEGPPGGWARAPEGSRSSRGGGGLLPARGTTGAPLERGGGGGRVSPGVGPCRFMAARHGTISPFSAPESLFWGGCGGEGGGAGGCCVHPPTRGGGVAAGSSVRRGR